MSCISEVFLVACKLQIFHFIPDFAFVSLPTPSLPMLTAAMSVGASKEMMENQLPQLPFKSIPIITELSKSFFGSLFRQSDMPAALFIYS